MENKDTVIALIHAVCPIAPATQAALHARLVPQEVKKGEYLLRQGDICQNLWFMNAGFAMQFHLSDGEQQISYFWGTHDIVTSMPSFLSQQPSREAIQVQEDCELCYITYAQLQWMYQHHPDFNAVGRIFLEKYYLELAGLGELWKIFPAKARYQHLLAAKPELFQKATLGQLASYLNISRETLSRIRGSLREQ